MLKELSLYRVIRIGNIEPKKTRRTHYYEQLLLWDQTFKCEKNIYKFSRVSLILKLVCVVKCDTVILQVFVPVLAVSLHRCVNNHAVYYATVLYFEYAERKRCISGFEQYVHIPAHICNLTSCAPWLVRSTGAVMTFILRINSSIF